MFFEGVHGFSIGVRKSPAGARHDGVWITTKAQRTHKEEQRVSEFRRFDRLS